MLFIADNKIHIAMSLNSNVDVRHINYHKSRIMKHVILMCNNPSYIVIYHLDCACKYDFCFI
jgi:hypothetical protein